jgi:hypothetical protein
MPIPNSFQAAETFLSNKSARPVKGKRSTQVVRLSPDEIALRYHGTSVVTWNRNGDVILRTNGWHSVTTKARINDAAPCRVWQHKFKWFVGQSSRLPVVPFEEGMVVRALPKP